nr:S-methyl-5-thioribose-1-phosphate isomerase [Acidithiobacillus montserratensis]
MPIVDNIRAIRWEDQQLCLLDQRLLPQQEIWLKLRDYREVAVAITQMVVRGAPAIGVTAAYAMALALHEMRDLTDWQPRLAGAAAEIRAARPTAVNLAWATDRQLALAQKETSAETAAAILLQAAHDLLEQDIADNQQMGRHGAALLPEQGGILTHCNTGSLATGGYGTALGVIRAGISAGKQLQVYADETRTLEPGA